MDKDNDRDEQGLRKAASMERSADEAAERTHYFKLYATITTNVAPVIATLIYVTVSWLYPAQAVIYEAKFRFIQEYQLHWIFASWYVVFITRLYLAINANGARAAARVDRPDQHVYKLMDPNANKQPYVLMETAGAVGRFNRAQRAASNMDESLACFLSGLLLVAVVFGPIALGIAAGNAYGRVKMANVYKVDKKRRLAGFVPAMVTEQISGSLVGLVVIKCIFGGLTSYF